MATRVKNMTEGNPSSLIVTFALPLMAGNVFQQLYTVVDTMVVGKYLGVNALAAVGASDWLNWMILGIVQGFTQGFAILMAQEFGAKRPEQLKKVIGNSGLLSLLSALALVLIGQLAARPVLTLLQTPDTIIGGSILYLRIIFAGIPIVMAYNLFACILRSLGDGKTPLQAMVVASFTNIALDLLFVMVFHWGIAGAAIATLIAQLVSGLYCLYTILKIEFLKMKKSDFTPQGALCGKLMVLGSPMAFQNCIIAIGGMIVQFVVNGFGVLFIAGFTATNKLYGLLEIAAISYGYAMITYAGQNLGAGKTDRIRKGIRAALVIAVVTSVVIAGVILALGKFILSWFISGTPEEVEQTMQVAYFYLSIMSVSLPILYVLHVVRSTLQGIGNTFLPMLSGVVEFIMRTGTALLLPMILSETGIFFAEPAAWIGADVVLVVSYFVEVRKMSKPILFLDPVLNETLWGGYRLANEYGYGTPGEKIGECRAISALPGGDCVIKNGIYQGKTLSQLWEEMPFLFGDRSEKQFPLLIKILDAKDDLSIQVHPDDSYAAKHENGSLGKTECWYILDCEENSSLVIGHNAKTKQELKEMIDQARWTELIRKVPVKKGDFIQIEPGTVHAIMGGIILLEIQQSSDVTYRVYDYDRLMDGRPRKLHIPQSLDVITVPSPKVEDNLKAALIIPENEMFELISCKYYKVWKLNLSGTFSLEQSYPFLMMSVTEGSGRLNSQQFRKGDHFILPANFGKVDIQGNAEIILSTVND